MPERVASSLALSDNTVTSSAIADTDAKTIANAKVNFLKFFFIV
jgi:hypothetical protein